MDGLDQRRMPIAISRIRIFSFCGRGFCVRGPMRQRSGLYASGVALRPEAGSLFRKYPGRLAVVGAALSCFRLARQAMAGRHSTRGNSGSRW